MKYIKPINEFNRSNKNELFNNEEKFTVAYEIEMKSKKPYYKFEDLNKDFNKVYGNIISKYNMETEYDYTVDSDFDETEELSIHNIYEYLDDDFLDMADIVPDYGNARVKGIELRNSSYFKGLNEAFSFLDEFYSIKDKDKQFKLTHKTGLHVNVGYYEPVNWNILKGYLLLNEDFAFRGFEKRKDTKFAGSYKQLFKHKAKQLLNQKYGETPLNHLDIREKFAILEKDLNKVLTSIVKNIDEKKIGFNFNKLNKNYIEFRYAGGNVPKDILKEQTLHYTNIVYACCNPDYRKKDYIKKFINFIISLNE